MPLRIGFIGAGGIAGAHLRILAGMPEARVVALCDVDRERAERAAEPFGASAHVDVRAMVESEALDAVLICVPPFAHGEAEIAAAEAGLPMLIEKPIGLSVEAARNTLGAIEAAGVITSVGYHWRYASVVDLAKEALGDRPVALVRGHWIGGAPGVPWWRVRAQSGGQIVEQSTHIFDLARCFAGDVRSVYAVGYRGILAPKMENYDVDDASIVALEFVSGAVGSIASADIARVGHGAMLTLIAEDFAIELRPSGLDILEKGKRTHVDAPEDPKVAEDAAFLKAVRTGDPSEIRSSYADALKTLAVTLAANESLETGEVVRLD